MGNPTFFCDTPPASQEDDATENPGVDISPPAMTRTGTVIIEEEHTSDTRVAGQRRNSLPENNSALNQSPPTSPLPRARVIRTNAFYLPESESTPRDEQTQTQASADTNRLGPSNLSR